MKLDKLLLFSGVFLTLVLFCHGLQHADYKSEAYDANIEGHYATVEAHLKAKKWPEAITTYKIIADAYASAAIAFLQKNDADSAIEAYRYAAVVNNQIALIAQGAKLLTEAIEAGIQEAQMYKQAAQLCKEASDIETSTFFCTCVAAAYAKMIEICGKLADKYRGEKDHIGEASVWLMAFNTYMDFVNSFQSAGEMDAALTMYKLAAHACPMAANAYKAAKNFDKEAKAWMQAAETNALSTSVYRQMDDASNEAQMYTVAASNYMAAARAYMNAANAKSVIEAYQLAVTQLTTAAQVYHNAGDHENEAKEYTRIARHHLDLNEYAQAGAAFKLAGQACLHAQNYEMALSLFQASEKAFTAANDSDAAQRVKSIFVTASS